jgi:hypothetical protein
VEIVEYPLRQAHGKPIVDMEPHHHKVFVTLTEVQGRFKLACRKAYITHLPTEKLPPTPSCLFGTIHGLLEAHDLALPLQHDFDRGLYIHFLFYWAIKICQANVKGRRWKFLILRN